MDGWMDTLDCAQRAQTSAKTKISSKSDSVFKSAFPD